MNKDNLAFLHDNLKYLGFGEYSLLNHLLESEMTNGTLSFELTTDAFFDEDSRLEAKLYFRRSDQLDMYFFNKYDALLMYPDNPEKNKEQTFYIYKGSGVTLKEAFNLLQGRAVYKKMTNSAGEKYTAWIQLNFEQKDLHENYKYKYFRSDNRYDLGKVLANYKLREMENEETREMLFQSLRRGNLHPVTLMKSNKTEKLLIHANPQFKTINIVPSATRAVRKEKDNRKERCDVRETPDLAIPEREVNESVLEEDAEHAHQKNRQ
ncbi:MAG TPA: hypothetical protein VGQ51_03715 [Puia sp.]|jgi:hypothetical protein|nr:hypothetical protein [Puia sp.]